MVNISRTFQEMAFPARHNAPHLYSQLPAFISFLARKLNLERISTRNYLIKPLLTSTFTSTLDLTTLSKSSSSHVIFSHFKRKNGFVWGGVFCVRIGFATTAERNLRPDDGVLMICIYCKRHSSGFGNIR